MCILSENAAVAKMQHRARRGGRRGGRGGGAHCALVGRAPRLALRGPAAPRPPRAARRQPHQGERSQRCRRSTSMCEEPLPVYRAA